MVGKMLKFLLAVVLLIGGPLGPVGSPLNPKPGEAASTLTVTCPGAVSNPENGHLYQAVAVPSGINWYDANTAAQALACGGTSGHLATITSASEQDFIATNFAAALGTSNDHGYWIGGKSNTPGVFEWVTGEPFGPYTNWNTGEPSGDPDGAIHFFGFDTGGRWNDATAGLYLFPGYVVEFPSVGCRAQFVTAVRTCLQSPDILRCIKEALSALRECLSE